MEQQTKVPTSANGEVARVWIQEPTAEKPLTALYYVTVEGLDQDVLVAQSFHNSKVQKEGHPMFGKPMSEVLRLQAEERHADKLEGKRITRWGLQKFDVGEKVRVTGIQQTGFNPSNGAPLYRGDNILFEKNRGEAIERELTGDTF